MVNRRQPLQVAGDEFHLPVLPREMRPKAATTLPRHPQTRPAAPAPGPLTYPGRRLRMAEERLSSCRTQRPQPRTMAIPMAITSLRRLWFCADPVNTTAPGGTFPAGNLACNSCHDNHGRNRISSNMTVATGGAPIIGSGSYSTSVMPAAGQAVGVYRLLRGLGDVHASGDDLRSDDPPSLPLHRAPTTRSEGTHCIRVLPTAPVCLIGAQPAILTCLPLPPPSTRTRQALTRKFRHDQMNNYNAYKMSGNMTGASATAYNSLSPVRRGGTGGRLSNFMSPLKSMAKERSAHPMGRGMTNSQVMCLTCHGRMPTGIHPHDQMV